MNPIRSLTGTALWMLLLVVFSGWICLRPVTGRADTILDQWALRYWGVEDGLSEDSVLSVAQMHLTQAGTAV